MSQNDQDMKQYNDILDIILRNALMSNINAHYGEIPSEEEIGQAHTFSREFQQQMRDLMKQSRSAEPCADAKEPAEVLADRSYQDQSFWDEWKAAAGNQKDHPVSPTEISPESKLPQSPETPQLRYDCSNDDSDFIPKHSGKILRQVGESSKQPNEKPLKDSTHSQAVTLIGGALPADESAKKQKQKQTRMRRLRKRIKIAAAAVVAIGILGIGITQFNPIRASFKQTVVNYEGQGVLISNESADNRHIVFRDPTYIPKGYELTLNYENKYVKCLEYSKGGSILKILYILFDEKADSFVDNERHSSITENIMIKNKYDGNLSITQEKNQELKILSWQNGTVQYQISSCESEEIIMKIAESIMQ